MTFPSLLSSLRVQDGSEGKNQTNDATSRADFFSKDNAEAAKQRESIAESVLEDLLRT